MFDEYINAHGKRLFGLCLKLCAQREDAEDLYQETWIKAYRFFDRYDSAQDFERWLTALCVNTFRDSLRRQKWKSLFIPFRSNAEKDALLQNIPTCDAEDFSEVKEAVDALPNKYRLVTVLYYREGCDVKRTAALLSLPEGTVKYQLHKAREILKRRLEPYGR
ncbi:MAG: sigma-70 family RNA polymerase sigma factor [Oscillospiraceae bacterium]|nr:sigma-70 family RNA polymerase sigma factor [Oscillospiraceae bacterium]